MGVLSQFGMFFVFCFFLTKTPLGILSAYLLTNCLYDRPVNTMVCKFKFVHYIHMKDKIQAGAKLGQAQVKLDDIVEVVVEIVVKAVITS